MPKVKRKSKLSKKDEERVGYTLVAIVQISEEAGKWKKGVYNDGHTKCPACGKDLFWTRSGYNGHIWGSCKTKGCLSWIQ